MWKDDFLKEKLGGGDVPLRARERNDSKSRLAIPFFWPDLTTISQFDFPGARFDTCFTF